MAISSSCVHDNMCTHFIFLPHSASDDHFRGVNDSRFFWHWGILHDAGRLSWKFQVSNTFNPFTVIKRSCSVIIFQNLVHLDVPLNVIQKVPNKFHGMYLTNTWFWKKNFSTFTCLVRFYRYFKIKHFICEFEGVYSSLFTYAS